MAAISLEGMARFDILNADRHPKNTGELKICFLQNCDLAWSGVPKFTNNYNQLTWEHMIRVCALEYRSLSDVSWQSTEKETETSFVIVLGQTCSQICHFCSL